MAVRVEDDTSFAVVVSREEGAWEVGVLPERLVDDLDGLIAALRQQASDIGSIAFVDVADEFFVALRLRGGEVRILLSDVTAAVAWDLAREVVERLDMDVPGEDDLDDVWPAGDLSIFADLGLDEMELGAVLADSEAYADEMLTAIAERLGFGDAFQRAVDAAIG